MGEVCTAIPSNECWKSGPKPAAFNSIHLIMYFLPKQVLVLQNKAKSIQETFKIVTFCLGFGRYAL